MNREPKLAYVMSEGASRRVSDFADLPPKARPPVYCPACEREVILHLGSKYVHHAAHQPDALCALTRPETARHFNTKFHLYLQLASVNRLLIAQPCYGWWAPTVETEQGGHRACAGRRRSYLWLEGWDRVEVEKAVGSRKPDVVLYREGRPVAAIEVRATHAVDMDKRHDLEAAGIPWIEVEADEDFYEGYESWTPDRPLAYVECSKDPPAWTCDSCQRLEAGYEERTRKRLVRQREQEREERLRRAEEARQYREQHEERERWRSEEVRPLPWLRQPGAKPIVVRTKKVRDGRGREVFYTIRQETQTSPVVLRANGEEVTRCLGPYTAEVAGQLNEVYLEHRRGLGAGVIVLSKWEKGDEAGPSEEE
jgi:hypothetical protein